MNYRECCEENLKIVNKELSMWNDLDGITSPLNVNRIPIQAKDVNDHEHTDIDKNKTYLVVYDGRWVIGKFKRNYHNTGWEINIGLYSAPLSSISMIYEIKGLPEIPKELLKRIDFEEDNESD